MTDTLSQPNLNDPTCVTDAFSHPLFTAKGETRAYVAFDRLKTLWFNTGTLCNITCENCYIESSPKNDRLVYLTLNDVKPYLDEVDAMASAPIEIGITGGEPFLNPEIIDILHAALNRGHQVLVLTNAMRPMMRPQVQKGLLKLNDKFADKLKLRISLDHFTRERHDEERGAASFQASCEGLTWLAGNGFHLSAAARSIWDDDEMHLRAGFAELFAKLGADIPVDDPERLVIFPEMDEAGDPPEITTACWDILGKNSAQIMCASSRMVIKRKGVNHASVISCTLLPYDDFFELGNTLLQSLKPVQLKHKFCAQFCVLGGASCSA